MTRNNRTVNSRRKALSRARRRNAEFASFLADPKSRFKSTTSATTTKSSIKNYLERPSDNFNNIAATMRQASVNNGIIRRVIDYYQSQPTYNHSIYPLLGNKVYEIDSENMHNDYIDVAYGLEALNVKFYAPYFFKETLIEGASFFYKVQDTSGVAYIKFPVEWCRISSIEDGVYRYRLDISKLKSEVYDSLPTELQQAYDTYHGTGSGDTSDTTQWYDNKWFYVSNKGVAFTFDPDAIVNGGTAISPFAGILADSLSLDQAKDNIEVKDKLDTLRIIHSKIPVDSNGEPTLSLKTAKIFDDAIRSRLPDGVVAVSSPTNLTNVPLTGAGNAGTYETVNDGLEQRSRY